MDQHDGTEQQHDDEGTPKPGGLGEDGTIPPDPDGIAATTTDQLSTFEPEEDEAADASVAGADDHPSEPSGDGPSSASAAEGGDPDPMQDAGLGV